MAARSADAYALGNNTPYIVYELVLGGVLSATLVPIFVEQAARDDPDGASAIVTVATVVLIGVTVLGVVAAPLVFELYAWNLTASEADRQAELAVPFIRMFMPQMLFFGWTALATALLNAKRRFFAPAFVPVLNNLVVSIALLAAAAIAGQSLGFDVVRDNVAVQLMIGLGTTAGIVAMTLPLLPAVRRAGWRLRWLLRWRHPAVIQVVRLSGWTIGYVVANQVALAIVLALAYEGEGWVAAYTYAFVFFQLPHGLIAVSFMTTFVPEMAAAANDDDWASFRDRLSLGIRLMATLILPASVGYVLLSEPLVRLLLARSNFTTGNAELTAKVLAGFAVGLLGFSVYLFALRGFYALRDTRTPFILNVGENALQIAVAFALVGRLEVQGLALALAVAYSVSAVVALAVLGRRVGGVDATPAGHEPAPARRRHRRHGSRGLGRHPPCRRDERRRCAGRGGARRRRRRRGVRAGPARPAGRGDRRASGPSPAPIGSEAMFKALKRWWKYLTAKVSGSLDERADPKVQLEQAIMEAQQQHRRLKEQAANVIANQKQTEMRLNRAMEEMERVNGNARQAVLMADEAGKKGNQTKAVEYTNAAEAFANRLIALEQEVETLKTLSLQSTQAAEQAKIAVTQNANALQKRLSERQRLLSQLDQVKMQEQLNKAMASLSETVGEDVPTLEEVREKIELRYARARGMAELQSTSVESHMLEIEQASMNAEAQNRLAQIRAQLGLAPAETEAPAVGAAADAPIAAVESPDAEPAPVREPGA